MSEDAKGFNPEYDDNKRNNIIYFGEKKENPDGSSYRKVELFIKEGVSFLSEKNSDSNSIPVDFEIKNNVTLYQTSGGQQKIHCWLIEDSLGKYPNALHISRRTGKGVYGSQEITLSAAGISSLYKFLNSLTTVDTPEPTKLPIKPENTDEMNFNKIISEDDFVELIKANIQSTDDFYKLLHIQKNGISY